MGVLKLFHKKTAIQKIEANETEEVREEKTLAPLEENRREEYLTETVSECPVNIAKVHGIGSRDYQQDCFGVSDVTCEKILREKGVLAVVADGMGGLESGEKVSMLATVSMLRQFEEMERGSECTLPQQLREMVEYTNQEVNDFLGEEGIGQSGSTMVTALLYEGKFYWASIGDSCIYFYHDGRLRQLNERHNYALELQEMVERGEITAEEAVGHPQRNALTSYLGAGEIAHLDYGEEEITLAKGDRILLMTDGVFGTVSFSNLEEIAGQELLESAMKLKYEIENSIKKNQDNYTALILEYKGN